METGEERKKIMQVDYCFDVEDHFFVIYKNGSTRGAEKFILNYVKRGEMIDEMQEVIQSLVYHFNENLQLCEDILYRVDRALNYKKKW